MFRILATFLVLFVGAAAIVTLLPAPKRHAMPTALAAAATPAAGETGEIKAVRVVYPPSAGTPAAISEPAPAAVPAARTASASAETRDPPAVEQAPSSVQPDMDAVLRATAKVDINTASVDEMDQIPGAGRVGRAIASRRPYRSVEDLLNKRVLRKSVYERIKDQVAAQ